MWQQLMPALTHAQAKRAIYVDFECLKTKPPHPALLGVLIGAADYRFLGRAAFWYLVAVVPLAALVLALPQLGIAGIWGALVVWMALRATVNHVRTRRVLGRAPA